MILVTGATGTVGREVLKRLADRGQQIRAVTRNLRKLDGQEPPHVQFVQGDFDDPDSMRRACTGVERAFLLSNSTERAEQQQVAFVEMARKSGVQHIVKLSQYCGHNPSSVCARSSASLGQEVRLAASYHLLIRSRIFLSSYNFRAGSASLAVDN